MRMYGYRCLEEWSRRLRSKYGNQYRLYSGEEETLERWSEHLSNDLQRPFVIRKTQEETLEEWSKLIGG